MSRDGRDPIRTVRIPDALWEASRDVAKAREESVSRVVRDALERYVKRHR